jgi:hypothetical protein
MCFAGCTAQWDGDDVLEVHGMVLPAHLLTIVSRFGVTQLLATPALLLRLSEQPNVTA